MFQHLKYLDHSNKQSSSSKKSTSLNRILKALKHKNSEPFLATSDLKDKLLAISQTSEYYNNNSTHNLPYDSNSTLA